MPVIGPNRSADLFPRRIVGGTESAFRVEMCNSNRRRHAVFDRCDGSPRWYCCCCCCCCYCYCCCCYCCCDYCWKTCSLEHSGVGTKRKHLIRSILAMMYMSVLVHLLCCVSAMGSLGKQGISILFDASNCCSSGCENVDGRENWVDFNLYSIPEGERRNSINFKSKKVENPKPWTLII